MSTRQEKLEYLKRKKQMIEFEKTNFGAIVFFEGMDGFYVAGGNSAKLMYNVVVPELGLKVSIQSDRDFEQKFSGGIMHIRNLDKYKEMIPRCKRVSGFVEKPHKLIFKLDPPYTPKEFETIAHAEDIRRDAMVNLISSTNVLPKTYNALRGILKVAYKGAEKKSDAVSRQLLTHYVIDDARSALIVFLEGVKRKDDFQEYMDKVDYLLRQTIMDLVAVNAAGVWSMEQVRPISFAVVTARENLAIERKQVKAR